jgi:hypothetical protein
MFRGSNPKSRRSVSFLLLSCVVFVVVVVVVIVVAIVVVVVFAVIVVVALVSYHLVFSSLVSCCVVLLCVVVWALRLCCVLCYAALCCIAVPGCALRGVCGVASCCFSSSTQHCTVGGAAVAPVQEVDEVCIAWTIRAVDGHVKGHGVTAFPAEKAVVVLGDDASISLSWAALLTSLESGDAFVLERIVNGAGIVG